MAIKENKITVFDSVTATLQKKERVNAFQTGHGVIVSKKYKKDKKSDRYQKIKKGLED